MATVKNLREPNVSRQMVRADHMVVDEKFRRVDKARAKRIAAALDLDGMGEFIVSDRGNGKFVIIDGQHRHTALMVNEMGEWEVPCRVHHGLAPADEARLFRVHNNASKPSALDDYFAALKALDPTTIAIDKMVHDHGLVVARFHADETVTSIRVLQALYAEAVDGQAPGYLLGQALEIAIASWGRIASATEGQILRGLALMVKTYGDEIERDVLIKKLSKYPGGASGIVGQARALREVHSGTMGRLIAAVMVARYNAGRRSGKLAPL